MHQASDKEFFASMNYFFRFDEIIDPEGKVDSICISVCFSTATSKRSTKTLCNAELCRVKDFLDSEFIQEISSDMKGRFDNTIANKSDQVIVTSEYVDYRSFYDGAAEFNRRRDVVWSLISPLKLIFPVPVPKSAFALAGENALNEPTCQSCDCALYRSALQRWILIEPRTALNCSHILRRAVTVSMRGTKRKYARNSDSELAA